MSEYTFETLYNYYYTRAKRAGLCDIEAAIAAQDKAEDDIACLDGAELLCFMRRLSRE